MASFSASGVPPGFRFHPTEEELLHYYLRKKVAMERIAVEVIREVDLNKVEPWELQDKCASGSALQNEWYFFSRRDRKYPTGLRMNRATAAGFWKATGRDKCIGSSENMMGTRKTLVFYRGRAPHGQKTDWIMHEYRLHGDTAEDGWVVCRVFKKKALFKDVSMESSGRCVAHDMPNAAEEEHRETSYVNHPVGGGVYKHGFALHPQLYAPPLSAADIIAGHRRPNGGGFSVSVSGWTMLDGGAANARQRAAAAAHTAGQIHRLPRGEMELWGCGKTTT